MIERRLRKFLLLMLLAGAPDGTAVAQPSIPALPEADRRKLDADLQRYQGDLDGQRVSRCAKRPQALIGLTPGSLRRTCGPWQHQSVGSSANGNAATLTYQVGPVAFLSVVVTQGLVSAAW